MDNFPLKDIDPEMVDNSTKRNRCNAVGDRMLSQIVNRIKSAVKPQAIILFGSYAKGNVHTGSDLDLLVIADVQGPRHERAIPIYRALCDVIIPMDIVVYNRDEIREWSQVPQAFITTVIREGKVLYEKQS